MEEQILYQWSREPWEKGPYGRQKWVKVRVTLAYDEHNQTWNVTNMRIVGTIYQYAENELKIFEGGQVVQTVRHFIELEQQ